MLALLYRTKFLCFVWRSQHVHFCNSYALISRNLVLTLSYLTKTLHLNSVYYAKWQAEIGVQII